MASTKKNKYPNKIFSDWKENQLLVELVTETFAFCVSIMRAAATLSGLSYKEVNAIVFLIFEPVLVLLFFGLWRWEKLKYRKLTTNTKDEKV